MANLPVALEIGVAIAVDDDAPPVVRLRAFKGLEQTKDPHRREVAERLVVALSHAPDLAARAHVALLVLAPDLKLLRDDSGGFVVADRALLPMARGLDQLHRLFGPGDDLPAFLLPPDRPAPEPYRAPQAVRDEELAAVVAARLADHEALIARMQDLGLDPDDLDDDAAGIDGITLRRKFAPLKEGIWVASFDVDDDLQLAIESGPDRVPLGHIRAGHWWTESTAGDHRGARRMRLALAHQVPQFTTRRERVVEVKQGGVRVKLGKAWVDVTANVRGVVVWIDEDRGDVVGVTLSWSTWIAPKKPGEPDPKPKPKPRL
ncbi:MAG: hypothetical protein Q8O67_16455 [Deltaproteobacteria bacterium]|nr:hypothetical protein [Deltaproteobacteria bacterium]